MAMIPDRFNDLFAPRGWIIYELMNLEVAKDAIEKAARELNVPVDEIGIEILSDSARGFFSLMGGRKVKIRAWSKRESREKLNEDVEKTEEPELAREQPEGRPETTKAQDAREVLEGMLSWLSEQASVKIAEESKERIRLEINGDKTGLLIGKRGQTLDALQFLVNKMVNRTGESSKRIEVDMEQYRKRREQSLRNMATQLGEKVKKKRKPITIEAMNAHDRRIIHLTLKSDQSLETKSVGKGEMRKLVIHLAQNGRSREYEGSGVSS